MKKQCLNCGNFQNMEVLTCPNCTVTNQFRIIKEEIQSANLSKKLPAGHCPNCEMPLEDINIPKCPVCKLDLKKHFLNSTKTSKRNGQYFKDLEGEFDPFMPKFSLT